MPTGAAKTSCDTTPSEYDLLAQSLEWRRHPDSAGRYLNVFIEQNNTCNLKCRMCGFSDSRVAAVPRYHMPTWVFEAIARQVFPATTYLHMSLMTEPFMTADFPDRLMLVREYGVPYSRVVTNGTLLTERTIEKILDAQITARAGSTCGGRISSCGTSGSRASRVPDRTSWPRDRPRLT